MAEGPFQRLRRFLAELKRRNVYRVAVTYAVVAFVVAQAANLFFPALQFPSWTVDFVIVLTLLGFPLALVLAWAFEMTPEGVKRTPPEDEAGEPLPSGAGGWVAALLVLLVAGGGYWYLTSAGEEEAATESAATTDTAARTAASRDTAGPPRIAVLPFENIAPDSTDDYFARGMHEEVLNQLSKVSGLEVLSRTTMIEMADAGMTAEEIGRELEANAILEGTVRRAGDQLRITTQLIKVPEDAHLWSNTYERELSVEEIFDIQADIAEQIAGALETQLTGRERQRIESAPTDNLAAYDAYLQGRSSYFRGWATDRFGNVARKHFRTAIRRDSTFAEAQAWLGLTYAYSAPGEDDPSRWLDSARAAVERAKAIDPELPAAHLAQGYIYERQGSTVARIETLDRAVQLQPSNVFALGELSDALATGGRYVEGVRLAHEAVQLAPRRPVVLQEMADQLRAVGLYEAAEAWDRRVLEIEPGHLSAIRGLMATERLRGQPDRALRTWEQYLAERDSLPDDIIIWEAAGAALAAGRPEQAKRYLEGGPGRKDVLGLAELRLGNEEQGRKLLLAAADTLRAELERGEDRYFWVAKLSAALGQTEEALRYLERWNPEGVGFENTPKQDLLISPFFDDLRSDPRFQKIVREVNGPRAKAREEVLQLGIDLYPPGTKSDNAVSRAPNS